MYQILNESQQINAASTEVVMALFYSSAFVDWSITNDPDLIS
jgi:hypothetical protein